MVGGRARGERTFDDARVGCGDDRESTARRRTLAASTMVSQLACHWLRVRRGTVSRRGLLTLWPCVCRVVSCVSFAGPWSCESRRRWCGTRREESREEGSHYAHVSRLVASVL